MTNSCFSGKCECVDHFDCPHPALLRAGAKFERCALCSALFPRSSDLRPRAASRETARPYLEAYWQARVASRASRVSS